MNDVNTITSFLNDMVRQDQRGTTFPIYYTIRWSTFVPAADGCGDKAIWIVDDWECMEIETEEMCASECNRLFDEWLEHNGLDTNLTINDYPEGWIEFTEGVRYCELKRDYAEKGVFLTEKDAKAHLEANHYHYGEDAHTYVRHAWRAPEMAEFFKALLRHFDVGSGNSDARL